MPGRDLNGGRKPVELSVQEEVFSNLHKTNTCVIMQHGRSSFHNHYVRWQSILWAFPIHLVEWGGGTLLLFMSRGRRDQRLHQSSRRS